MKQLYLILSIYIRKKNNKPLPGLFINFYLHILLIKLHTLINQKYWISKFKIDDPITTFLTFFFIVLVFFFEQTFFFIYSF